MDFNHGYNGLILIGCIWAIMMALLFLTLFCVISQLPSGVQVKTKHGQVYPDIEISDGKDPGTEEDLPSVMLPCEQVRFDESLSGDNRYINSGAVGGKTGKTSVLPRFSKIEGGAPQ